MNTSRISVCYFPTSVAFVDDNRSYLETLKLFCTSKSYNGIYFENPHQALTHLIPQANPQFLSRCLCYSDENMIGHQSINIDLKQIRQEYYNQNRFEQVSVVVVDYSMPQMNGAEFSQFLQGSKYKIILLTGEANHSCAIDLFNQGIIHYFIRKDDRDFVNVLNTAISRLQNAFFADLSEIIIDSIMQTQRIFEKLTFCLADEVFNTHFQQIIQSKKICEYYLLDESGSFLLIDINGNIFFLVIKTEEDMRGYLSLLEYADEPHDLVMEQIASRTKVPFFYDELDYLNGPENWLPYLHPAKQLIGKTDVYYYSLIDASKYNRPVQNSVVSYKEFLHAAL